jgi:hypothetical protein
MIGTLQAACNQQRAHYLPLQVENSTQRKVPVRLSSWQGAACEQSAANYAEGFLIVTQHSDAGLPACHISDGFFLLFHDGRVGEASGPREE